MKKFLSRTLVFGCFFIALFSALVGILVWNCRNHHVYIDEYGHKVALLKDTPSPRVIFLGGSNVAFGIDSRGVEDSLGINVVNYGLQAGLGLRLMMTDALECCRKGDVLVVAPEYEHFYGVASGEKRTLSVLALMHPQILGSFNPGQFMVALSGMKDAMYVMTYMLLHGSFAAEGEAESYSYSSLSFNSYGDEENHWSVPIDGIEVKANYLADGFDEGYFIEFLDQVSELEARGVEVVLIPPSVFREFYDGSRDKMHYVESRLAEGGRPFAYGIERSVYGREDIFDSYYHLSRTGVDKRMKDVMEAVKHQANFSTNAEMH